MKILVVTNMYPYTEMDYFGNFVEAEVNEITAQNHQVDILFVNGRKNKLNYFFGFFRYLLRFYKYDIVHFHHTYVAIYSVLIKPRNMVFTMHEGGNYFIEQNKLCVQYKHGRSKGLEYWLRSFNIREKILKKADSLILAFGTDAEIKWQDKKVSCIAPGVDKSRFLGITKAASRRHLKVPDDSFFLLFPHEPREEKNVALFEQLVTSLKSKGLNIVSKIGGTIPMHEMPIYLAASDVFYILSKFESSPMVAKEGIMAGSTLISFDVGDLKHNFSKNNSFVLAENIIDAIDKTESILATPPKTQTLLDSSILASSSAAKVLAAYRKLVDQ